MEADYSLIYYESEYEDIVNLDPLYKAMERIKEINIKKVEVGDKIYAKVIGVWRKFIRIECLGADFVVKAQDLQYGYIEDVSKIYKINEEKRKIYSSLVRIIGSDASE